MLEERNDTCPYCGAPIELLLDLSAGSQDYVEDCTVCCRPIEISLAVGVDGELEALALQRSDD